MSKFILVCHEAEKRGKHYDLRFEIPNSKLWASFALNDMPPTEPNKRIYIPRTNDHSEESALYVGKISEGEYGAGIIKKIDGGECEIIKYRNSHIIVDFKGKILKGKYHFINVGVYDRKRNYKKKVYGFFKAKDVRQLNEKQKNLNESLIITGIGALTPMLFEVLIFMLRHFLTKKFLKNLNKEYDENFSKKLSEITNEKVSVYEIDRNVVNAFTMGKKDDYVFYYFTGLKNIINLTDDEIISILLHEYGHCKENHGPVSERKLFINSMLSSIFSGVLTGTIAHATKSLALVFYPFMFVVFMISSFTKGFTNRSLRWTEINADKYPAKFGYKKEYLSALTKMKKYIYKEICGNDISENECEKKLEDIYYFDVHPPIKDRIKIISKSLTKILKVTLSLIKSGNVLSAINFLKSIVKLQKSLPKNKFFLKNKTIAN